MDKVSVNFTYNSLVIAYVFAQPSFKCVCEDSISR